MSPTHEEVEYPLGPALDLMRQVSALNHALERLSSRMDRELGITAQQRLVLRCVGKYPGITAGQLAAVLHLDPGTVSASLRRLDDRQLLERRPDPRDRRRITLGLTTAGRDLDRPTAGTVEEAIEQLLREADAEDVATTKAVLARLAGLLEAACDSTTQVPTASGSAEKRRGNNG